MQLPKATKFSYSALFGLSREYRLFSPQDGKIKVVKGRILLVIPEAVQVI